MYLHILEVWCLTQCVGNAMHMSHHAADGAVKYASHIVVSMEGPASHQSGPLSTTPCSIMQHDFVLPTAVCEVEECFPRIAVLQLSTDPYIEPGSCYVPDRQL